MHNPHFTVFISYSSRDYRTVRKVVDFIKSTDINVWFDDVNIIPGTAIIDRIHEGISDSQILILFISKNSIKSKWVNYEWNSFIDSCLRMKSDVYLIPVVLDEVKLPNAIARFRYLKFQNTASFYSKLKEAVRKIGIEDTEKKRGFQVLLSEQTDRIVNKKTTILTQRTIIKPIAETFRKYVFRHWQNSKGKIELLRTEVLEQQTGNVVEHALKELKRDENNLEIECKLRSKVNNRPVVFIFEVMAQNYFPNLFSTGSGYSEFLVRLPVQQFLYQFIVPNKIPYKGLEVSASYDDRKQRVARKVIGSDVTHSLGPQSLDMGKSLKVTINNPSP